MINCPKCSKQFKNEVALRMHDMRVHTKQIKTPGQLGLITGKKFRQPWSTGKGWSQEQIDLLLAIEEQYTVGNKVMWEQAFIDHPEWEADLGNRNRTTLTQKLGYIHERGKHSPKAKVIVGGKWNDEQIALLLKIEANYRKSDAKNSHVDWRRAFIEHPEWKDALGGRTPSELSAKASYLKLYPRPDLATARAPVQVIQTRPRGRQSVVRATVETPATNGHTAHVAFCPECGAHIRRWNQVAEVMQGLPK